MKPDTSSRARSHVSIQLSQRRNMRLDAPGSLRAAFAGLRGRFIVRDISMGGFGMTAATPLPLRSLHTVTLTLGSIAVNHRVRVQHCRRNPEGGWFTGLAFVDQPLPGGSTVGALFNAVLASAISFS